MKPICLLGLLCLCLCGCANGPTHDYYSPTVLKAPRFNGPLTMQRVDDVEAVKSQYLKEGYAVIGISSYVGKYPEAAELKAQARRVHAHHVVYSCPPAPASWEFSYYRWGGGGGSSPGMYDVRIVFLGR